MVDLEEEPQNCWQPSYTEPDRKIPRLLQRWMGMKLHDERDLLQYFHPQTTGLHSRRIDHVQYRYTCFSLGWLETMENLLDIDFFASGNIGNDEPNTWRWSDWASILWQN